VAQKLIRSAGVAPAKELLGWELKAQLREGLKKTIGYFDTLPQEGDPLIVGR
jgi:hypothetical protein